jgi:hypothetical protein
VEGGVFDAYSDANVKRIIDLSDEVAISLEHGNAKYLVSFSASKPPNQPK